MEHTATLAALALAALQAIGRLIERKDSTT